ncbi:hypothetical protein E2562_006933 [Oryza meyeriana var. granulata]|uniref:Uncharacterized protein n=1 Tax=Oryza meyeriana var. granulata TaxID=110450 RepID=A0A6G1E9A5_9ORYZ|nr:hypothetical protein E2562_006933 [Oryza meyeriana var. granulata]
MADEEQVKRNEEFFEMKSFPFFLQIQPRTRRRRWRIGTGRAQVGGREAADLRDVCEVIKVGKMLLALVDEAYTGSAIEDASGNAGSDDSGPLDLADLMFLDLLKDENYGIAYCI